MRPVAKMNKERGNNDTVINWGREGEAVVVICAALASVAKASSSSQKLGAKGLDPIGSRGLFLSCWPRLMPASVISVWRRLPGAC